MQGTAEMKAGAQISQKAFFQSVLILLALMVLAGILTRVIPAGSYGRSTEFGREVIVPDTFAFTNAADYPVWRWFTAPLEVLGGPDGATIIVIILFLVLVGTAFGVLDGSGILHAALGGIVRLFGARKYALLLAISFFFTALGAFFGIFEEVVPLVPLMIALSLSLGWDSLVGLGMSVLATNVGFSAAITNPFTIGVAQELAELPLFSGAWLRVLVFLAAYLLLAVFLVQYARKIERKPEASPVYREDQAGRAHVQQVGLLRGSLPAANLRRASIWLGTCLILILLVLVGAPFVEILGDLSLPLVGLLFFVGGVGAGALSGAGRGVTWKAMKDGFLGIAPAIPLILMAASIKYIVAQGGVLDTILHAAAEWFTGTGPFAASVMIYGLALAIEFFIGSGSAKAFLMMPVLLPLANLVGVTRQVTVTAYCFGDGFSNLAYPTNPVLLVVLGLTVVSYPKWIRWLMGLWIPMIVLTLVVLALAVAVGYGPF